MQKVNFKNISSRVSLFLVTAMLTFSIPSFAQTESADEAAQVETSPPAADGVGDAAAGKALFNANCAACHKLDKKATGPMLRNVAQEYDRDWLYKWISNSQGLIASGDALANEIFEANNKSVMTSFPGLSTADMDNILAYTSEPKPIPPVSLTTGPEEKGTGGTSNTVILGGLAFIFLLLITMLFLVTGTLKKIAAHNGVAYPVKEAKKPLWKAFVENQFLLLVSAVFLLLTAAYFMYGFFMQVGVDQGYAPVQPIHYSHRIHAGDNEIDCNYCHSSARKSKHSGIPSLNVCMNCHKNIGAVSDDVYAEGLSEYGVDYNKEI
jgi:mono/diheme cytochrome c family protein